MGSVKKYWRKKNIVPTPPNMPGTIIGIIGNQSSTLYTCLNKRKDGKVIIMPGITIVASMTKNITVLPRNLIRDKAYAAMAEQNVPKSTGGAMYSNVLPSARNMFPYSSVARIVW